jgi:hypothetical protein
VVRINLASRSVVTSCLSHCRRHIRALRHIGILLPIGLIHRLQMLGNLAINRCHLLLEVFLRDYLLAARHRFDLGSVDRKQYPAEQRLVAADADERPTNPNDRLRVILAKIGDRLERRRNAVDQPLGFQVAARFPLQPPARTHLVEVAIDVQLQETARRIGRPAVASATTLANPSFAKSSRSTNASITRTW